MRSFNCLAADCPIFGPHLLEASAGTGKTFAIEHVFVRLLLEDPDLELEEILAVTFTRAATRDLKSRIRANLEAAASRILEEKSDWEYLEPYFGSEKAARKLSRAALNFDRAQIFTIHGFCYRMLQEFAFEANLGLTLPDPDGEIKRPGRLLRKTQKFLEERVGPDLLCPEQVRLLFSLYPSMEKLAEALIRSTAEDESSSFQSLHKQYEAAWASCRCWHEGRDLLADFRLIAPNYKGYKDDLEAQVLALTEGHSSPSNPLPFRALIEGKGTLFTFLDPSNKKVRAPNPDGVPSAEFFSFASTTFAPLIKEAITKRNILNCLRGAWKKARAEDSDEEEFFSPDEILFQMKTLVTQENFAELIRKKYKAAVVDEFQDTDPLQWEIFRALFLIPQKKLKALYLVGDPKQSIYRFRRADVYTYFQARQELGENALFHLDTNYRSSPHLIEVLNLLFSRNFLQLPKIGGTIPCPPVKAGKGSLEQISDGKGSLHFLVSRLSSSPFEECFLPFTVAEIERLIPSVPNLSSFALLVKDRHQARAALQLFQDRGISAIARSHTPLGKTDAFRTILEAVESIANPRDPSLRRIVETGPLANFLRTTDRSCMEETGIIPFCQAIAEIPGDGEFCQDASQVIEELLSWEGLEGFSIEGLLSFLNTLAKLDPEEGGRRRLESELDAVQILTLHISKGLEYDVVFALGVAATSGIRSEDDEAEITAEKQRLLYVALTRAKRRLYVPISTQEKAHFRSSPSPIELFRRHVEKEEGPFFPFLEKIATLANLTIEELPSQVVLPHPLPKKEQLSEVSERKFPSISGRFLHSFTSLAQGKEVDRPISWEESEEKTPHTIPRGTETGILIHQIYERLFSSPTSIWKNDSAVEALIEAHVRFSALKGWEEAIKEMVEKTLSTPLMLSGRPFCLKELEPDQLQAEMEFVFERPPHCIKGFIDLVFSVDGKYYFLDWKTNWLGKDEAAYQSLTEAMATHDYWLQASLYSEALHRHVKRFYNDSFNDLFGGAIYYFVRGNAVHHFIPRGV